MIFYRTFEHGLSRPIDAITSPDGLHAFWLTIALRRDRGAAQHGLRRDHRARAGAPGIPREGAAQRGDRPSVRDLAGRDRPGAVPASTRPNDSWFGGWFEDQGIQIIFSVPGMVLATIFVSLPFVVREVMPVLQEIGTDQEQAAETLGATPWQTFWQVTLPAIRWGVTYGVVLATARALGEFGAVSDRLRQHHRQDRDAAALRPDAVRQLQRGGRLCRRDRARDPRDRGALQHEPPPAATGKERRRPRGRPGASRSPAYSSHSPIEKEA